MTPPPPTPRFQRLLRRALCGVGLPLVLVGCASVAVPSGPESQARVRPLPDDVSPVPQPLTPVASAVVELAPAPVPQPLAATVAGAEAPQTGWGGPALQPTPADLWARMRSGFTMPELDGDIVTGREQFYAGRADMMRRMTERSGRYLFHIVEEVERRQLPTELALLPFVESAFNPQALSVAQAAGMWQFIPSTGKDFDLKQNAFRDDRRDVLASTRAALDYLTRLYGLFNDWHLALAAYNWGEGNVRKAIQRNERAGLPTDYASLRMPDETRLYVPKLQAIKNIVREPERFGVALAPMENHPYFISVPVERDIDVKLAAKLAEVPMDEFRHLNPQLNRPVILAAGTDQLLLPYDNAVRFSRNLQQHGGPLATWTAWVAPRTVSTTEAARLVGMPEEELRNVNRIPPRMRVQAGSTLVVPRDAGRAQDVAAHIADHGMLSLAPEPPPLQKRTFRAGRKGETVMAVAARHGVSVAQFLQWNKLGAQDRLRGGTSYVVYVPRTETRRGRQAAPANLRMAQGGAGRVSRPAPPSRKAR